ncbi:UNVERIFIED_CONTAM: hypothetical protein Sradi_0495100 [Sesamum radiatum]|uniref:Uncharacterized protein n=1 Tax=Sesamum radiatum TaxID=300843 RepID=A0AAW2VHY0_SESRA
MLRGRRGRKWPPKKPPGSGPGRRRRDPGGSCAAGSEGVGTGPGAVGGRGSRWSGLDDWSAVGRRGVGRAILPIGGNAGGDGGGGGGGESIGVPVGIVLP